MTTDIEDIKGMTEELIARDNFCEERYLKEKEKNRKVNQLHMAIGIGIFVILWMILVGVICYTFGYNAGYDAALQHILQKTLLAKFGVMI